MPRFYRSPQSRFIVTDRDSVLLTFFDRLARERETRHLLGAPASCSGLVPADNPEVNILHDDDFADATDFENNYPFLHEGVRLLYKLRQDDLGIGTFPAGGRYSCRFAGIIMETDDAGTEDRSESRYTAYDPWAFLYLRPCRQTDGAQEGELPNSMGLRFSGSPGSLIAPELLAQTIAEDGPVGIDAGTAFGGTAFYDGVIETTADITALVFQRGTTVGEAWAQLVDTGTMDIVLKPIYDPINRPGYMAELNIYAAAGSDAEVVHVFSRDRSGHDITDVSRYIDGRERANKLQFYAGQGGIPVGLATSAASVTRYGQYWIQQFFVKQPGGPTVSDFRDDEIIKRQQGIRTWRMSPTTEFSPVPYEEYDLGHYIRIYHSNRLREEQEVLARVVGFTVNDTNSIEQVTALDVTVDDPPADASS